MKNSIQLMVLTALISATSAVNACTPVARRAPSPAAAPGAAATPLPRPTASYDSLLARLRAGDLMIDYLSLRLAYAETPDYAPYDFRIESKTAMRKALTENDCRTALSVADSILATNYVDIEAHIVSSDCMNRLGDHAKANHHGTVARGLLESIRSYASGRTSDSAIVVIDIDEEYMLLATQGLERTTQALSTCAGHPCDVMQVVDRRSGKTQSLYFNVAIPFGSFGRTMRKDTTARTP